MLGSVFFVLLLSTTASYATKPDKAQYNVKNDVEQKSLITERENLSER